MDHRDIHSACQEGDLERVKEFLAKDRRLLHSKDEVGYLPIHRAADHGPVELVEFLLDMGADLEALDEGYHETPLFHAALGGNVDTASFLINRGAKVNILTQEGYTPLINAILGIEKLGHSLEIAETLLEAGADPNLRKSDEWSALHEAVKCWGSELVEMLLGSGAYPNGTDGCGETAALTALRDNNLPSYEVITRYGGRLNSPIPELLLSVSAEDLKAKLRDEPSLVEWKGIDNWTLLHWATNLGRLDIVETLLEKGLRNNPTENEGLFPIHVAARNGFIELVDLFVRSGVLVDTKSVGPVGWERTPLHIAALENDDAEVVRYLLSQGASVNQLSGPGYTALHEAARSGNVEIAGALIEHGADKNAKTHYGKTAMEIASEGANDHLISFL